MCLDVFVLAGQLKIRTSNSSSASEQSVFVNFDWSDALCPLNGAIKLSASIAIVRIEHCSLANDVFSHQNSENVPKDIELDPMQIQFLDVQVSWAVTGHPIPSWHCQSRSAAIKGRGFAINGPQLKEQSPFSNHSTVRLITNPSSVLFGRRLSILRGIDKRKTTLKLFTLNFRLAQLSSIVCKLISDHNL